MYKPFVPGRDVRFGVMSRHARREQDASASPPMSGHRAGMPDRPPWAQFGLTAVSAARMAERWRLTNYHHQISDGRCGFVMGW